MSLYSPSSSAMCLLSLCRCITPSQLAHYQAETFTKTCHLQRKVNPTHNQYHEPSNHSNYLAGAGFAYNITLKHIYGLLTAETLPGLIECTNFSGALSQQQIIPKCQKCVAIKKALAE